MTPTSRVLPFLLLPLLAVPVVAHAAPLYTITTLGNSTQSQTPNGLNNSGQVVGFTYGSGPARAFVGSAGGMTDVHPASASHSAATAINNAGVAVGNAGRSDGVMRATSFSEGVATDLGALGGAMAESYAGGINASGQVSGTSQVSAGGNNHAFRYSAGIMHDLGTLGGTNSIGRGINDNGAVVGLADVAGDAGYHAFRYLSGTMQDLGTLGGNYSDAWSINNGGTVVGSSYLADENTSRAFWYDDTGGMVDLGTLGGNESFAYDINTAGEAVGSADTAEGIQHAFVYKGGIMYDLNSLVDPASGWVLNYAAAINDNGQIAAEGCNAAGICQALLLELEAPEPPVNPVPEPEPFSALLAGLALLGIVRHRQRTRGARQSSRPASGTG